MLMAGTRLLKQIMSRLICLSPPLHLRLPSVTGAVPIFQPAVLTSLPGTQPRREEVFSTPELRSARLFLILPLRIMWRVMCILPFSMSDLLIIRLVQEAYLHFQPITSYISIALHP